MKHKSVIKVVRLKDLIMTIQIEITSVFFCILLILSFKINKTGQKRVKLLMDLNQGPCTCRSTTCDAASALLQISILFFSQT